MKTKKTILVNGATGFIGFHLYKSLLKTDHLIFRLDNINDYYDINLKYARLKELWIDRSEAEKLGSISQSIIHNFQMQFIRLNKDLKNDI